MYFNVCPKKITTYSETNKIDINRTAGTKILKAKKHNSKQNCSGVSI